MSVGGATFAAAGTLSVGSGNTFTVADATEDDYFDDQAWWTFTVASPATVDLAVGPGGNFALFRGTVEADLELVFAFAFDGGEVEGVTARYLLEPGTYYLIVGVFGGASPTEYAVTYTTRAAGTSPWISDLYDDPTNVLAVTDADGGWAADVIRPGTRRLGDYNVQESLGGPWGTDARDCAISHALNGDQNFVYTWNDVCPALGSGAADLEVSGGSNVTYHFDSHTGLPILADNANMTVSTVSWGIWLKPVEENLDPRGVLDFPDPVDYGYSPDAVIEWESDTVELIGLTIADNAGSLGSDPDSRYAVNYDLQPTFSGGTWGAWQKGFLPGSAVGASVYFASEGVADADKTQHDLDIPAGGFADATQDYLNDTYDYGVIAGPAEAFSERTLSANRSAAVGIAIFVQVRSPRFRFLYETATPSPLPASIPPRRIFPRNDGATQGSRRVLGGGNTRQAGSRTLGSIL